MVPIRHKLSSSAAMDVSDVNLMSLRFSYTFELLRASLVKKLFELHFFCLTSLNMLLPNLLMGLPIVTGGKYSSQLVHAAYTQEENTALNWFMLLINVQRKALITSIHHHYYCSHCPPHLHLPKKKISRQRLKLH